MLKQSDLSKRLTFILKSLLISYLLTAGLLLLLALFLYRFGLSEQIVSMGITAIYILVTFLAGFLSGKREGNRKFLWGLLMGSLYFLVLALISLMVNHGVSGLTSHFFSVLVMCAASGMLGGMIS